MVPVAAGAAGAAAGAGIVVADVVVDVVAGAGSGAAGTVFGLPGLSMASSSLTVTNLNPLAKSPSKTSGMASMVGG